jgi:hypothetical protein
MQITLGQANSAGQSLLHLCLVVILDRPEGACCCQQASEYRWHKTQHEQAGAQPRKTMRDNSHGKSLSESKGIIAEGDEGRVSVL